MNDPFRQLERSHRRLEEACDALALAAVDRDIDTVTDVCAFLGRQVRRHEEDEERSLFPRLLVRAPELAATVARLREEHEAHAVRVGALVALCQELQTWPERFVSLRGDLNAAAWALEETWRVHLTLEETELFPALRTALSAADQAAIREEMKARRARLPPK